MYATSADWSFDQGDIIKVDCSVADKVSCIMSYMEQT